MFSRVATTVARAPLRAAARSVSSRAGAAAALTQQTSSTFAYAAATVACLGALGIATQRQESSPALCAKKARPFPYTGAPGTANERSFIVSPCVP